MIVLPRGTECALAALLFLVAGAAGADEANFRPYLVGGRAAGMGGAFTALADDGSGPYYNPGGLAFVTSSQLSLSAAVYGRSSGTLTDALGQGHDFEFATLNTFPVVTAAVWKLGEQPEDRTPSAHVLSLSVFVPDAEHVDARDQVARQQNAIFQAVSSQTVWVGPTYARRLGRLGFGASLFLLFGTSSNLIDLTLLQQDGSYETLTVRTDQTVLGLVAALGMRFDVDSHLRLGASLFTPEFGLGGGSRSLFARLTNSADSATPIAVLNATDLHASPTQPLRVQIGAAWTSGRLTLSADAVFLAARDVLDDPDTTPQHLVRRAVLNGSLGAEYVAADRFPLRAGFFTDFSATPRPVDVPSGAPDPNPSNTLRENRIGASLSGGVITEHTATDLGLNLRFGRGKSLEPRNLDFGNYAVTDVSEMGIYLFIASSYRF
jgi:long-chain fatty acid transport protein